MGGSSAGTSAAKRASPETPESTRDSSATALSSTPSVSEGSIEGLGV